MNKERLKVGILFFFSDQWMGGIIYILNLIRALNFLDDEQKPEITLFYRPGLKRFLDEIDYPYLTPVEWNFPSIIWGNVKSRLLGKNLFIDRILKNYSLDTLFPIHDFPVRTNSKARLITWSADLQHKHYPEFFSKNTLRAREFRTKNKLKNCDNLVLSSYDVLNDYKHFYNLPDRINTSIYHFVSVMEDLQDIGFDELKKKYNIPDKYFIVSNQFHKHKNHKVLLEAQAKLKKMGIKKHMLMTGKFPNDSNSPYIADLNRIIGENQLQDQISFLGIIPRNDQLQLMKYSQAVIQPSLFEGWSTVIEDARSLQVPVVAANLRVNIEQLGQDKVYFEPHNADELVSIIKEYPERNLNDKFYEDYEKRVKDAAETLMQIFS